MKRIFALGGFLLLMFTGPESTAQEKGGVQSKTKCVLHIEKINFKKPRTDCTRGFGFCVKAQYYVLAPHTGLCFPTLIIGSFDLFPRIENGEVYAGVAIRGDELIFLIPEEIRELEDYKDTPLDYLEIEDKIKLITQDKWTRNILPQKAPMQRYEGYLMYALQLSK